MTSLSRVAPANKRPRVPSPDPEPRPSAGSASSKRQKTATAPSALPADFFEPTSAAAAPGAGAAAEPDFDAEWAAFQAEVVATPPPSPPRAVDYEAATISAAPVRAGEEPESKEERAVQDDLEGEKEEAQQKLLEEFEEMESLEERVRRLKERREALKAAKPKLMELDDRGALNAGEGEALDAIGGGDEEDEDEDEEEEEDLDFFLRR